MGHNFKQMVKDQEYLNSIASQTIEYSKKLGATDVNVEVVHSISETVNLRNKQLDESNRSDSFAIGITTYINKKKSTISSSNLSKDNIKILTERCIETAKITPDDEFNSLPDNKYIGFSKFFFNKTQKKFEVTNVTNFEVKLVGITVFSVISEGLEIYENDQLIYFKSDTVQNDKKKFVEVFFDEENRNFKINGSSYKGTGNLENIIGNWWNHRLLQSDTQISPLSGSIKKQSVEFLKKEKIRLYENEINVEKFRLKSTDESLPKDKRLDFEIWYDKKRAMIVKIRYKRLGTWEYRLKKVN